MTRDGKPAPKRKARKTRRRPLLQFRVLESEYKEIAKAAAQRELTISEEAARRLQLYLMTERHDNPWERIPRAADRISIHEAPFRMEELGYRKMDTRDIWLGPSEPEPPVFSHAELEELLVKAARMGAELALNDLQK